MKVYPSTLPTSLDFEAIKLELGKLCQTKGAQALVSSLKPFSNRQTVTRLLHQTNEVLSLYLSGDGFPSTQFESIEAAYRVLQTQGTVLEERQFADIRTACTTYASLYKYILNRQERLPQLFSLVHYTAPDKEINKEIDLRIHERSQVRSNASPELRKIRNDLGKSRAAADRIFARMLKKYRTKGLLADFDESISEDRRVLAIQSAYKGQVQGIFHGSSAKHSIVYLEPGETVEINNEIASLIDEEKKEIRRILKELSDIIRPKAEFLEQMEKQLTRLDFIKAKAVFAHRENCCLPTLSTSQELALYEAFNPVLKIVNRERGKPTVPLDIFLDAKSRVIVISGPNAGGKSITLKTLGLLQLMLQSGLLIPVNPKSRVCLFQQLFGDIGDNQSIENELSTYSSKLEKMRYFLNHCDDQTLLLIDEFGSGSDPELGSSLAQVFLEKLNSYNTYGIFTTHYNAIKAIAASTPGISNGAMLFNSKTFEPEYRLEIGNPGSSYTFEVAEKTGIPKHIIKEARQRTSQNILDVDKLLVQIQDEKLYLEKKSKKLSTDLSNVQQLEAEKANTIKKLEDKLAKQSRQNEENDRVMYWGQRFQKLVEGWLNQSTQKDKKEVVSRFIGMLNQRSGETQKEEKKSLTKAEVKRNAKIKELTSEEVKVGDSIKIIASGIIGTIAEVRGEKYQVVLGNNITTSLLREQFISADARLEPKPKAKKRSKNFSKKSKKGTQKGDKPTSPPKAKS